MQKSEKSVKYKLKNKLNKDWDMKMQITLNIFECKYILCKNNRLMDYFMIIYNYYYFYKY